MKFACEGCGKKYVLSDDKIADKRNVRLKCKACGELITVKREGELIVEVITTASLAPPASIVPSGPPPADDAPLPPVEGASPFAGVADDAGGSLPAFPSSAEPAASDSPAAAVAPPSGEAPGGGADVGEEAATANVPPPPDAVFQALDAVNASHRLPPMGSVSDAEPASPVVASIGASASPLVSSGSAPSAKAASSKRTVILVAVGVVLLIVVILALK